MIGRALACLGGLGVAVAGAGCRGDRTVVAGDVTGIEVAVSYGSELPIDQLVFSGLVGGTPAFPPGRLPETPRPLAAAGETAVVLLPEWLVDQQLLVRVDGLAAEALVATGTASVTPRSRVVVRATVALGEPATCGDRVVRRGVEDCDDGNLDDGDGCSSLCLREPGVCNAGNCSEGCCQGMECRPGTAADACGTGGLACESCGGASVCVAGVCSGCDAATCPGGCCSGATCYPRSVPTCGVNAGACRACDADRADTCAVTGECRCGGTAPCGDGQRCDGGVCVCDEASCPDGCCAGNVCRGRSLSACGAPGAACRTCDTSKADTCSPDGACRCGDGPACGGGQRCSGGLCICDGTSCPSGCCVGNRCELRGLTSCGDAGSSCVRCDLEAADNCSVQGGCRCGTGPSCPPGQRCTGSGCFCDGSSCPEGCCTPTGACLSGDATDSCGSGGGACRPCPAGQACRGGVCSGCNASTCPAGCCSGADCLPLALATCGARGAACAACNSEIADGCSAAGACACGMGSACADGQRCVNGSCGCDVNSCPNGCCQGGICRPLSLGSCGSAGGACAACPPGAADACSPSGTCTCGAGPACSPGQRCVGGACVCDATSCPSGCCANDRCVSPSVDACGTGGGGCFPCAAGAANSCSPSGTCTCGGGPPCGEGQRCAGGVCVCNAASCPTGCCAGTTCQPGTADGVCGAAGAQCQDCGADRCVGGACEGCATSCPMGCCSGPQCKPAAFDACGVGGSVCVPCEPGQADTCSATGECRCGMGAPCGAGQRCVGGSCVCDATSCPDGCCAGNVCTAPTFGGCASGGAACDPCDPSRADSCSPTGQCLCGGNPGCGMGQRCVSGNCVCNAQSCSGCCMGPVCHLPSIDHCGIGGASCAPCPPNRADSCGPDGVCMCGATRFCKGSEMCDPILHVCVPNGPN